MPAEKVDLVAAILKSSVHGTSKGSLQDQLNITSIVLDEYVRMLMAKDLISILRNKGGKIEIKTTERGKKFLELYDSIKARYLTAKPQ